MEKKCAIVIGLAVAMLAAVPVTRASMATGTVSYGAMTYNSTAGLDWYAGGYNVSGRVDHYPGDSFSADDAGSASANTSLVLDSSFAETQASSAGGFAAIAANPGGGIEGRADAVSSHWARVLVTQAGTLSMTLPYEYRFHAETQNPLDWASAYAYMQIQVMDMGGTWDLLANDTLFEMQQFSSDGISTDEQTGKGLWTWSVDLTAGQELEVSLYAQVRGSAFTADVAPVPLPGAVLLGMLGLGYAGTKLRRLR